VSAAIDWDGLAVRLGEGFGVRTLRHERLARHTSMRVGGPADLLIVARDVAVLAGLVRFARTAAVPYLVLGRGSNVVVADRGIPGLVILCRAEGHRLDGCRLIAESGLPLARASTLAWRAGLAGLEFGLAIPGTVGGAVWANAGAHGSDVAAVLESATVLQADGRETVVPAGRLGFGYRESRLKHAQPAELVLSATFGLDPAGPGIIKARLDEIRRWRREHQPLEMPSAGSVFRNPPGDSAGRLIEACGLKGRRVGGAAISPRHANFIVNEGQARAADVRALAELARTEVGRRFGIELTYEIQFLGDWTNWQEER
jgi:UDP-N-acetylmuramate dehydrogenase